MSQLRFAFNVEKLVNALAFFSKAGVSDLTKLKAAKLLYFADKEHLLAHGRPILGDVYYCLPYGPVPSAALNEMNDAISSPEIGEEEPSKNIFKKFLKVHKQHFFGRSVFQALDGFDKDVFSCSELNVLEHVVDQYGRCTANQLVALTHKEPTWTIPNKGRASGGRELIPYELFFTDAPNEAKQMLEVLKAEKEEESAFDEFLSRQEMSASQLNG